MKLHTIDELFYTQLADHHGVEFDFKGSVEFLFPYKLYVTDEEIIRQHNICFPDEPVFDIIDVPVKWWVEWVKENIFNETAEMVDMRTRLDLAKEERDALRETASKQFIKIKDQERQLAALKAELEELRGFKAAQIVKEKIIEISSMGQIGRTYQKAG